MESASGDGDSGGGGNAEIHDDTSSCNSGGGAQQPTSNLTQHVLPSDVSSDSSYWSALQSATYLQDQLDLPTAPPLEPYREIVEQVIPPLEPYREIVEQVIAVLQYWHKSYAGMSEMKSFLRDTDRLLHEVEECIVALHYLRRWWKSAIIGDTKFVALDICCGKGYYSSLLSFLVGMFWSKEDDEYNNNNNNNIDVASRRPTLDRIILTDKATTEDINWQHIDIINSTASEEGRPMLHLWPGMNLYDYDKMLGRFQDIALPLAITGIHLCKMLSPALCSLVNGLGTTQCPYYCVAPCCLPRRVTKRRATEKGAGNPRMITVYNHESEAQRKRRFEYTALRRQVRLCLLCNDTTHLIRKCSLFPTLSVEEQTGFLQQAALTSPCWTCGIVGHFSADCPTPNICSPSVSPPMVHVDASHIIESERPFKAYCELLALQCLVGRGRGRSSEEKEEEEGEAGSVHVRGAAEVIECGFVNKNIDNRDEKKQKHWNSERKSIFIVSAATPDV